MIGRKFENISKYDMKRWPFKVVNKANGPNFEVFYRNKTEIFSPEQISAAVLSKMKEIAENYLNDEVTHAVITIPAHFNDSQRQATRDAAAIAGLNVLQLINEPTAAAVAYGLKDKVSSEQNILVFDMGGGTFDVSILTIDGEMYDVRAVGGDTHLGGEDFNNKLLDYFMNEIKLKYNVDLSSDKFAISELLKQCELAKIALSSSTIAEVRVDSLFYGKAYKSSISRARFEELNQEFFKKAIKIVEETIIAAKLTKADINEVVLVGGSTYIPKVQSLLQNCFNGKALNKCIKPDEAVAYGAAIYASILHGEDAHDLDLVLLDVTPYSLGVEVKGEKLSKIVNRNTPIPINLTKPFITSEDYQTTIRVNIYEGENELNVKKNNLLGYFMLTGIPPARVGVEKISISMEINADGILKVQAINASNGANNSIKIEEYKSRLSQNEIEENARQEKEMLIRRN